MQHTYMESVNKNLTLRVHVISYWSQPMMQPMLKYKQVAVMMNTSELG